MDDATPKLGEPINNHVPVETRIAVLYERQVAMEKRVRSLEHDRRWLGVAALAAVCSLAWQAAAAFVKGM